MATINSFTKKPSHICNCAECPLKNQPYVSDNMGVSSTLVVGDTPTQQDLANDRKGYSDNASRIVKKLLPKAHMTYALPCYIGSANLSAGDRKKAYKCCEPRLTALTNAADLIITWSKEYSEARGLKERGIQYGKFIKTVSSQIVIRDGNKLAEFKRDVMFSKYNVDLNWTIEETNDLPELLANEPAIWDVETKGLYGELILNAVAVPRLKTVFIMKRWHKSLNKCFLIGHNSKYDLSIIPEARCNADTMLMHYTMHENDNHGLKELAAQYFGIADWQKDVNIEDLTQTKWEDTKKYAALDVIITWYLYNVVKDEMDDTAERLHQFLLESADTLRSIELNGIRVDTEQVKRVDSLLDEAILQATRELRMKAFDPMLNPASPQQIKEYLYFELNLPDPELYNSQKKQHVKYSTDDDTLDILRKHDKTGFVDLLRRYRRIAKIKSSYIKPVNKFIQPNGRVHPTYNLHRAETGRLSANNPAIQTIPRPESDNVPLNERYGAMIRSLFIPSNGCVFVDCDYSQAELRTVAALSGEPFLLDVYNNGKDLHSEVARAIFGDKFTKNQRVICKTINFGWLYGANASVISKQSHIPIDEATRIVNDYEANMPVLINWRNQQFEKAKKYRYVDTPFGRRRRFPIISENNYSEVRKASVNMPVQSIASDLTLSAANKLAREGFTIVLLVHDSIVVEAPVDKGEEIGKYVSDTMKYIGKLHLPQVEWEADWEIKKRWAKSPFEE
jgi:DNA polymerase I-like protein with 3'-5' exonuclease and polymerase domains